MGTGLFGGGARTANSIPVPVSSLRVQTSLQGKPIPIGWGQNRIAGNLIWYGNFKAIAVQAATETGGKGGNDTGTVTSYNYRTGLVLALCEGPIAEVIDAWKNQASDSANNFGFTSFLGTYVQSAWGFLTTSFPTEALPYRGLAYEAQSALKLGGQPQLPNFSFEVRAIISNAITDRADANPKEVTIDFLTNSYYGVGFPSARLDLTMTQFSNYCIANGLLISDILTDQREANAFLADLFRLTNSSPRWSSGILTVIPWGDAAVTGNGVTYTPDVTPLYDLTDDDYLPNQGGSAGNSPIQVTRKRKSQMLNDIKLEYLDRENNYDPVAVDAKDQASIDVFGLRASDMRSGHMIKDAETAVLSATLQLNREQIPNVYTFTLPPKFILPDPEDILTLTRYQMGLDRQPVRIIEINENDDGSLTFECEDYLGTASAPLYGSEAPSGRPINTNVDPGGINDPLIFEPTDQLANGLEIWAAVSGADLTVWGGCNVLVSYDGITYQQMPAQLRGSSRMGFLTAILASVTANPIGQTIDEVNTLSVDLTESQAALQSGLQLDATSLNTACYIGGEIVAYQTATLTATYKYDLTYLVRGGYGTDDQIASHPIGTAFARLDQGILKIPYEQSRIGSIIYIKFQSFNLWGGGLQDISTVAPYTYTIQGTALTSPLPDVQNVRAPFEAGFLKIWWDDITTDFRTGIRYQIMRGDSFAAAEQVGDNAHPPFIAFGAGTYWIRAYCQPLANLFVYSENPTTITISGNMLTANVVATFDQRALGWLGTFSNGVAKDGVDPTAFIRLGGSGNILDIDPLLKSGTTNAVTASGSAVLHFAATPADISVGMAIEDTTTAGVIPAGATILSFDATTVTMTIAATAGGVGNGDTIVFSTVDILDFGGIISTGTYEIPSTDWIDVGYVAENYVNVTWQGTGLPVGADVLTIADILAAPDILGAASTQYINVFVEIATSQDAVPTWGAWEKFVPGVYLCRMMKFRVVLTTLDPATIAYCLAFSYSCSVLPRIDHYQNLSVLDTGMTFDFEPDTASTASPFNGGPLLGGAGNQPLPYVNVSWSNPNGHRFILDALSLASITFHFVDSGGLPVAETGVNIDVEGY